MLFCFHSYRRCTTDGFPRLLPLLIESARNKSAAIRRRCVDYAMVALARWGDAAFERHLTQTGYDGGLTHSKPAVDLDWGCIKADVVVFLVCGDIFFKMIL